MPITQLRGTATAAFASPALPGRPTDHHAASNSRNLPSWAAPRGLGLRHAAGARVGRRRAVLASAAAHGTAPEEDESSGAFDVDMGELRRRMREVWSREQSGDDNDKEEARGGAGDGTLQIFDGNVVGIPEKVWVLIFDGKEQGIYSIRYDSGSGKENEVVLAFACEEDAERYKGLLLGQNFPKPDVASIAMRTLQEFCNDTGFRLGLVPKGTFVTPPAGTVDGLQWAADKEKTETALNDGSTEMSSSELEQMRRRLNDLL